MFLRQIDFESEFHCPRRNYEGASAPWLRRELANTLRTAYSDAITPQLRATFFREALAMIEELLVLASNDGVTVAGTGADAVAPEALFDEQVFDGIGQDVDPIEPDATSITVNEDSESVFVMDEPLSPADEDAVALASPSTTGSSARGERHTHPEHVYRDYEREEPDTVEDDEGTISRICQHDSHE